jgi:hypothetical protein
MELNISLKKNFSELRKDADITIVDFNDTEYKFNKSFDDLANSFYDLNSLQFNMLDIDLYNLAVLCDYGVENSKSIKEVQTIYEVKDKKHSNMFISKFIKELFHIYYNISNNLPQKKFQDIENIVNLDVIMKDLSPKFLNWYYYNRNNLTWEYFDQEKDKPYFDPEIKKIIENNFKRTKDLSEHVIVPDCYFKTFILKNMDDIKENYEKYLECKDCEKIRKYLFKIMVLIYSLETQHYYHVLNKGRKFKHILIDFIEIFDNVKKFCDEKTFQIKESHIQINKYNLIGEFDFISDNKNFFDIKCCSDITLKHIVQQTVCNILYNNLDEYANNNDNYDIKLNFLNLITGKMVKITLYLTREKIKQILGIMIDNKKSRD